MLRPALGIVVVTAFVSIATGAIPVRAAQEMKKRVGRPFNAYVVTIADGDTLELLGTVSLSLFLARALMALRLWELVSLALPILAILALQMVMIVLFATYVTFRVMGGNYDAAVIAAGHCGFGLGATPTAIANMQAVTTRYGHSALAFLLVPVIGAFLVDITNALVIQGYLALPQFGF